MSQILQISLIIHILSGLAGIVAFTAFLLLISRKDFNLAKLKIYSVLGTIFFFIVWIAGGYYYTVYYGGSVKPLIVAGDLPWIHTVVMESKEHLFLMIPFLSIVVTAVVFIYGVHFAENKVLVWALTKVTVALTGIAIFMVVAGFAISGSVKKTQVSNFEFCAEAGYQILESFPRTCVTLDGQIFTEVINE